MMTLLHRFLRRLWPVRPATRATVRIEPTTAYRVSQPVGDERLVAEVKSLRAQVEELKGDLADAKMAGKDGY